MLPYIILGVLSLGTTGTFTPKRDRLPLGEAPDGFDFEFDGGTVDQDFFLEEQREGSDILDRFIQQAWAEETTDAATIAPPPSLIAPPDNKRKREEPSTPRATHARTQLMEEKVATQLAGWLVLREGFLGVLMAVKEASKTAVPFMTAQERNFVALNKVRTFASSLVRGNDLSSSPPPGITYLSRLTAALNDEATQDFIDVLVAGNSSVQRLEAAQDDLMAMAEDMLGAPAHQAILPSFEGRPNSNWNWLELPVNAAVALHARVLEVKTIKEQVRAVAAALDSRRESGQFDLRQGQARILVLRSMLQDSYKMILKILVKIADMFQSKYHFYLRKSEQLRE